MTSITAHIWTVRRTLSTLESPPKAGARRPPMLMIRSYFVARWRLVRGIVGELLLMEDVSVRMKS